MTPPIQTENCKVNTFSYYMDNMVRTSANANLLKYVFLKTLIFCQFANWWIRNYQNLLADCPPLSGLVRVFVHVPLY